MFQYNTKSLSALIYLIAFALTISMFGGCSDREKIARELYIQSTQDVKNGRADSAEVRLQKAVEIYPDFISAKQTLGEVQYASGKYDEAASNFEDVISSDSSNYTATYLLANSYAKKGSFERAIGFYRRAIKLRPDSVMPYNNYAAALTALNRFDEALAAYQTVITMLRRSPDASAKQLLASAYFDAATALGRKGDYSKAIEAYTAAISLNPDFPDAYYYLGITYYNQKDLKNTIVAFREAIKVKPDFARAYNDLGIVCGKDGDSASCLNYLGVASVLQGKFDEAIKLYRKAISHNQNFAEAKFNLGLAQTYSGRLDEAEKTFVNLTETKPDYIDAYLQLQTIYARLGKKDKAGEAQRKALDLGAKALKKNNKTAR